MLPLFVALWLAALVLMSPFPVRADPSLDGRALRIVMNDNSPPFSQRREDGRTRRRSQARDRFGRAAGVALRSLRRLR